MALVLAACAVEQPVQPAPPPDVEEATAFLGEVIAAGVDKDFERLCSMATGTCEGELEGFEHLAPDAPPRIGDVTVVPPAGQSVGGVLIVLCGADAAGDPDESQVLVFDDGAKLLAGAAVYWKGTSVSFAPSGDATTGQPAEGPSRC
jgi:hypothetical protein